MSRDDRSPPATLRVSELWRFPVKSLQGERVDTVAVTPDGIEGDRRFAIFDTETGYGLTARRVPELLFASAQVIGGKVEIVLPDGTVTSDDETLSAWLDRPVQLRAAGDRRDRHYENPTDFEHETTEPWAPFVGSAGPFHDSPRVRVSLVSTATLRSWDRRRFRANVVLEGAGEDDLVGRSVTLGDARLEFTMRIGRCVMTTRAQPDGIARDLDVLRTINREREGRLAVGALVTRSGTVHVGDALVVR